jgi:pimeloyl-ACP methyl ester carboxylesterase
MKCELKDIAIYYEAFGEGIPIIMLHGWSVNHRIMTSVMEPLFTQGDGWKRIYPDLPGHGRTPGKDWITNQDKILGVVLEFIDKVIPRQRFVIAGGLLGAYLARGVAYHRASFLDGLLLVIPMIVADDAKRNVPAHICIVKDPALASDLEPDQAEMFNTYAVVQSRKLADALRALSPSSDEMGDQKFQATIREDPEKYAFSFDVDAIVEPFAAPTLIVAGRQDSIVGYRQAWDILDNYPRGTFAVLDRAGHFLEFEQEEVFGLLVREWLDRVAEYAAAAK